MMIRKYVAGAFMLLPALLSAQEWGSWNAYGELEAVYWKPTHCPVLVAQGVNESASSGFLAERGVSFDLQADYDWGVRARLGIDQCCFFADIGYLYFDSTGDTKVRRGTFDELNTPISVNAALVRAHVEFCYQNADLRFGHFVTKGEGCDFWVYGTARWADLEMKLQQRDLREGNDALISLNRKSGFQGGGPGVGIGGKYCVWNGLGLSAHVGGIALIGRSKVDRTTLTLIGPSVTTKAMLQPEGATCVIPSIEIRLATHYELEWSCMTLGVEIAYQ